MSSNFFKNIISFICVYVLFPFAFLHAGNKGVDPAKDTTTFTIDREDLMDDEDDSLMFFQWDTLNIHSYNYDLKNLRDTLLVLSDNSLSGYAPPHIGEVTSNFGFRSQRFHYGIDIKLETGDPVLCAFKGKVRIAKRSKTYGNVVVVRHSNGLETIYAHLSRIDVEIGQDVQAGDMIGLGGNTGRSTGSHLHFEVRFKGKAINPNEIISFTDNSLISDSLLISQENFKYLSEIKKIKYYTIRKGDTLSRIAAKYGTTTKKLCKLNGIKSTTVLRVGRKIRCS